MGKNDCFSIGAWYNHYAISARCPAIFIRGMPPQPEERLMKRFGLSLFVVKLLATGVCAAPGVTAQETVNKVVAAMLSGDGAQLASCYKATPTAKGVIVALGNLSKDAMPFSEKMKSAYGNSPTWVPNFTEIATDIMLGKLTVNGNRATITLKSGKTQPMVKDNGVWLVVDTDFAQATPAQAAKVIKQFRAMSAGLRATFATIGTPGTSEASIKQQAMGVMARELASPTTPAPRPTPTPRPTLPPLPAPKPRPSLPPLPKPAPRPTASKYLPGTTPRATLDLIMLAMKQGKGERMVGYYKTTPAGAIMLKAMGNFAGMALNYSAAHKKFFGSNPTYLPNIQTMLNDMAKAKYVIMGDKAVATDSKGKKNYMVRVNGYWLAVDDDFAPMTVAQAKQNAKQVDAMTCTLNVLQCRIGMYGGKTRTAAELAKEFQDGVKQRS